MAKLLGTFFLLCLMGLTSSAQASECAYRQEISGAMVTSHFYTLSLGCVVVVTPRSKPDLIYREYYFDERGRFLVFDSQPGDFETATATRSFFFFPRRQEPAFEIQKDGAIRVTMSSGRQISISSNTPEIIAFPGVKFSEPESFGLNPQDFISIKKYPGLYLDTGSRIGGTGYGPGQAQKLSTFYDASGRQCPVKNSEIFDYTHILYAEPTFLFETDQKLADFLAHRCTQLQWDPNSDL